MTRWQIAVTYRHSPSKLLYVPPSRADRFARLTDKLVRGEDVSVLFFGDSITAGCTSSFTNDLPPMMPSWPLLTCEYLAKRYDYTLRFVSTGLEGVDRIPTDAHVYGTRGTLTYINTAVGGAMPPWIDLMSVSVRGFSNTVATCWCLALA